MIGLEEEMTYAKRGTAPLLRSSVPRSPSAWRGQALAQMARSPRPASSRACGTNFADLGAFEEHAIEAGTLSADKVAGLVAERLRGGLL